jgi:hypothetical protein
MTIYAVKIVTYEIISTRFLRFQEIVPINFETYAIV